MKKVQTSKAMVSYLSRAKEQDELMKEQEIAYQIGKRHLANMMGEDPNTFTQDDVNVSSIETFKYYFILLIKLIFCLMFRVVLSFR